MSHATGTYEDTTFGYILTKLGILLERTKDALIIDLKNELSSIDTTDKDFNFEIIDKIFGRIGVDLNCFEQKETIWEIGNELLKVFDRLPMLCEKISTLDTKDEDTMKNITPIVSEVLDSMMKIVKTAKKFEDFEVAQINKDFQEFGDELKNSIKELAPKIVDHIIITLLRNAREVFHDELVILETRKNELINAAHEIIVESQMEARELLEQGAQEINRSLKKINNEIGDEIQEVVDVMTRTYAILDFLGVIGDKDNTRIKKITDKVQDQMVSLLDLSSTDNSGQLVNVRVPAKIKVICWDRFDDLFSNPITYFQSLYPIEDIDDAGEIVAKVLDIARMFNPDVPDFASLQKFFESLIQRLEKKVLMAAEDVKNEIWDAIRPIIIVLRKVHDFLTQLVQKIKESTSEIVSHVQQNLTAIRQNSELIQLISSIKTDVQDDQFLTKVWDNVLCPSFDEACSKYDIQISTNNIADIAQEFKNDLSAWADKTIKEFETFVDPDNWEKRFDGLTNRLEKELDADYEALKEFRLHELSITDYTEIITEEINKVSLPDIEGCYNNFVLCFTKAIDNLSEVKEQLPDGKTIQQFVIAFSRAIWDNVKKNILQPLVRKLAQVIKQYIREKIRALLHTILDELCGVLSSDSQQLHTLLSAPEHGDKVKELARKALGLECMDDYATAAINLMTKAGEMVTKDLQIPKEYVDWTLDVTIETVDFVQSDMGVKDVLKYIISIFRTFPEREKIEDLLPSFDWSVKGKSDTETYEFMNDFSADYDMEKMFAMVNLFNLKGKIDDKQGNSLNGSLLVQFFVLACEYDRNGEKIPALYFKFMIKGTLGTVISIGKDHELTLDMKVDSQTSHQAEGDVNIENIQKGFGGYLLKNWEVEWKGSGWKEFSSDLVLNFKRKESAGALTVFNSTYADFVIGDYPQKFFIGINSDGKTGFDVGYIAAIKNAELWLKLKQCGFLKEILKDDISLKFDTEIGYTLQGGFHIDGDVGLHLEYDLNNKKIGPITIQKFNVDVGGDDDKKGTLSLAAGTTFQVDFGDSVTLALENLNLGLNLNYLNEDGKLGDWDLNPKFTFPSGIGVAVDSSVVKGGGMISINNDTGEFFGAVELSIIKKFGLTGFVICDPGTSHGHDFNFLVSFSALFDGVGIPLGMGFSLTAIGGSLGLNRTIDRDGLMQGVRKGTLRSVFFVRDIQEHMGEMKTTVDTYFPAKQGQFFLGMLAQISFQPIVKCDFGLMLQLPRPTQIIIMGALKVELGESIDLIRINVYFAGGIDFEEGMWFDASIVDSQIVGITLSGDMAFRLNWGGKCKGFLISIGGFHPAYTPEPGLHLGEMKRLAMSLDYSVLALSLEAYLAVSSNTFQLGARVDMKVDLKIFAVVGYASFDALFQFDPFMFMTSMTAGVTVKVWGYTLLAMSLAFELNGPARWHAAGEISFTIIGIPLKGDFSCTWGKKSKELPKTTVAVKELLRKEYERDENWSIVNSQSSDNDVELFATTGLVVLPNAVITFNQDVVPFVTEAKNEGALLDEISELSIMDKCNDARPIDYNKIELFPRDSVTICVDNKDVDLDYEMLQNDFSPSLYRSMEISEKLKSKSYVKYNSGFTCRVGDLIKVGDSKEFQNEYQIVCLEVDNTRILEKGKRNEGPQFKDSIRSTNSADLLNKRKMQPHSHLVTEDGFGKKSTGANIHELHNKIDFERYVRMLDKKVKI